MQTTAEIEWYLRNGKITLKSQATTHKRWSMTFGHQTKMKPFESDRREWMPGLAELCSEQSLSIHNK